MGYDPDVGNVPVAPASIGMWQKGWLGVLLFVIINALQFRLINSFLLTRSLLVQTLAVLLVGIPAISLIGPGDFTLMNDERALAIYFLGTVTVLLYRALFGPLPRAARARAAASE